MIIKFYVIAKTDYASTTIYIHIIIFQIINYYKNYVRLNKDKRYRIDLDTRPVKIEQIKKEIKHILRDHYDIIEEK